MIADAKRAAFEAWASHPDRHGKLPIEAHANGAYKDQRTYSAYYGWISSRKQALAEIAALFPHESAEYFGSTIQEEIEALK